MRENDIAKHPLTHPGRSSFEALVGRPPSRVCCFAALLDRSAAPPAVMQEGHLAFLHVWDSSGRLVFKGRQASLDLPIYFCG